MNIENTQVFISRTLLNPAGEHTPEVAMARELYEFLKDKGINVFRDECSLE